MVTLDDLLQSTRATEKVEIEEVGIIEVRALSRAEAARVSDANDKGAGAGEREMLRWGMHDPEMSYRDVERWMDSAVAGSFIPVFAAITRLSKLNQTEKEVDRETVNDFQD